jgi:succinate dehydrogenase/fumarate reductase flavoprotein subunit
MFAYDTGILKREDRLKQAFERVMELDDEFKGLSAPHTHELVRLKETEAMLLAARFILGASLFRTESRLSHFREDHDQRDNRDWLVWVDFCETGNGPAFIKTPVPTPLCPPTLSKPRQRQLHARHQVVASDA